MRLKYIILAALFGATGLALASQPQPHIVNGTPITPGNYPWFVSISMGCGGSLISPTWVLFAAHCVEAEQIQNPSSVSVIAGRILKSDIKSGQEITAKRIIPHPQYSIPQAFDNDIALIELTAPVNAQIVKLAPQAIGGIGAVGGVNAPGASAKAVGRGSLAAPADYLSKALSLSFGYCRSNMGECINLANSKGYTDADIVSTLLLANGLNDPTKGIGYAQLVDELNGAAGGTPSVSALVSGLEAKGITVLQIADTIVSTANNGSDAILEVDLPLVDNTACQSAITNDPQVSKLTVTGNMICAGYQGTPKDTCQGDSGGPLVMRNAQNTDWIQVGVVSWSGTCATNYGVYARVANYMDWIGQYVPNFNYDRVFAWGEAVGAPQLLKAAGNEASTYSPPYWARFYPASGTAVGVGVQDLNLYFYNGSGISNQGPVSGWFSKAQASGY